MKEEQESISDGKAGKYPRSVFFIIGNEFCERFSFYGMRAILTIYATHILMYDADSATVLFHSFIVGCYFSPIFGGIIADSYWGKFKTIFYISVIYVIGCIVLATGAIPAGLKQMEIMSILGLLLIAVGTGGIKPCVSAFGGDQFLPGQEGYLQGFFSLFYLSINLGSVISTFVSPIIRSDVHCFGVDSCFSLAFGIPALLMITALIIFLLGKPLYRMIPPEKGNIIVKVSKCIAHGIAQKCKLKRTGVEKPHWLDYADDKYDKGFLQDVKDLLHVLLLFLPLPMFWALFDQQGSRWTIQATKMNGDITSNYQLRPDQMQVINPLLIVLFIPLFEYFVYPALKKCHILRTPLQRITTGGLLAAVAFVLAGFLEIVIHQELPVPVKPGFGDVFVVNNSPCKMNLGGSFEHQFLPFGSHFVSDVVLEKEYKWTFTPQNCDYSTEPESATLICKALFENMMVTIDNAKVKFAKVVGIKEKPKSGFPQFEIFYRLNYVFKPNSSASFKFESSEKTLYVYSNVTEDSSLGITQTIGISPSLYNVYLPVNESAHEKNPIGNVTLMWGGTYVISIFQKEKSPSSVTLRQFNIVLPSSLSMLYQVPQYSVITAGEIMFSITGLEFSYSQSPVSMKSVLQAAWLLTVAIGDSIVVVFAELRIFENQAYEFFLYASLMAIDMGVFAILAYFYEYVTHADNREGSNDQIESEN